MKNKKKDEDTLFHNTELLLKNYRDVVWSLEVAVHRVNQWTIVNKVDTIYKEKCRVQLLSAVPSTILLFHLVSSFRENYAVS